MVIYLTLFIIFAIISNHWHVPSPAVSRHLLYSGNTELVRPFHTYQAAIFDATEEQIVGTVRLFCLILKPGGSRDRIMQP